MPEKKPGYLDGGWKQKYRIQKWRHEPCPNCRAGKGPGLAFWHVSAGRQVAGVNPVAGSKTYRCIMCRGTGIHTYSVDPDPEAIYFVLRLDTDPHARHAALAYANSVEAENKEFARDIREKVEEAL